jgi:hypothetical protein
VRVALLSLLAACSFDHGLVGNDHKDAAFDPDGNASGSGSDSDGSTSTLRQKTITIQSTVSGTHTDFPLWVSLTDTDIGARARIDGTDIHFVAGATKLDYQIQSWTKSSGRLDAWVRVPTLAAGTQIAVRYGDVSVAHPANPAGTFAGYQAVWHFEDALNQTTIADARNQTNGTAVQLGPADSVSGHLGRGINFTDGGDQITFVNPLTGNGPHTISAWVNQRTTNTNDCIIAMGNGATNEARWFHSRFNSATIAVGFYGNDYTNANQDVIGDNWVLLHWVFEGTNRMSRLYRNGTQVAGPFQHATGIDTAGTAGTIGNAGGAFGTNMGINATLDEVRIINVARSAAWLAAEALNQTTPGSVYMLSMEQTPN